MDLGIWSIDAELFAWLSIDPQSGGPGQVPSEFLVYEVPFDGEYAVAVWHVSGGEPGWIQLIVERVPYIEHRTGNGSIANPGESAKRGMLAVGAARWNDVRAISPISSRGPTPDGRVKPDIVGAHCGATALRPLNESNAGFCGTSQAAPHVAGLAALVRQRFPDYTPGPGRQLPERFCGAAGRSRPQQHLGARLRNTAAARRGGTAPLLRRCPPPTPGIQQRISAV